MKKIFVLLLFVLIIGLFANPNNKNQKIEFRQPNIPSKYYKTNIIDPIINITNNNELQAYAISGNGTLQNQYIISNYVLNNCTDSGAIRIQNTDKYFTLTNITIQGCKTGIELINVTYGAINNILIENNSGYGIVLNSTVNSILINNQIINSTNGYYLANTNTTSLINNTASSITESSFEFFSSFSNIIINNSIEISNSSFYGFQFNSISNNTIINNTITGTKHVLYGLALQFSHDNKIINNSISINSGFEYYILSSFNNTFMGNKGSNTNTSCFEVINSFSNEFTNNSASNCNSAINLQSSNDNIFANNTVINGNYGFHLSSSSQNIIQTNFGANNSLEDYLDTSQLNNTLINNIFISNTTNTSSNFLPPLNTGTNAGGNIPENSNGNSINFPKVTLPEVTVIALLLLVPFVGMYAYKKISQNKNGNKKFHVSDLNEDFLYEKNDPKRLIIIGPILALFATVYYSNKHKNLDYFDLKSNELRGKILTILDEKHFIHFNKLREFLDCGVSILKWHIQVLHEFKIVNWSTIGQYKVIYLAEKPPETKEVNLFYSLSNDYVIKILETFLRTNTWDVDKLSKELILRKDSVLHHCKKLATIRVLDENVQNKVFSLPFNSKELVKKILGQKIKLNSKRRFYNFQ